MDSTRAITIEVSPSEVAPSGPWRTRLLIRTRARCEPAYAGTLLGPLVGLGDFLNASAILRGIKQRGERAGTARDAANL